MREDIIIDADEVRENIQEFGNMGDVDDLIFAEEVYNCSDK